MNSASFRRLIEEAFNPFLKKLGFHSQPLQINGRFCEAEFKGKNFTLSVSFEPGDDYFTTMLIQNNNSSLAAIDDSQKTPHLSDLNRMYMGEVTQQEREGNEAYFSSIKAEDSNELELLKCAKELRLVLPRHLKSNPRANQ